MSVRWITGNLFSCGIPAIAHGCNCQGVMGLGVAAQMRDLLPDMYAAYRARCASGSFMPGDCFSWQHPGGVVFNLATQYAPGPDARTWMIAASVGAMLAEAGRAGIREVAIPEIGCGIGGLTTDDLRAALAPYEAAPVGITVVTWDGS